MRITVKLFATFREHRFIKQECDVPEATQVGTIVDELKIDRNEVGVLMVNSRHSSFDATLHPGDILAIFPVIGGG